tara:strand:- start:408 stop:692 length:285 start_codon:yes stop_codon:yes gene_type:complete
MEDWPNVHDACDVPIGMIVRVLDKLTDEVLDVGTVLEKTGTPSNFAVSPAIRLLVRSDGVLKSYGSENRFELVSRDNLSEEELIMVNCDMEKDE